MDFTDMFRTTSGVNKKRNFDALPNNTQNEDLENQKPSNVNEGVDSIAFVRKSLKDINLHINSQELTETVAIVVETLLKEVGKYIFTSKTLAHICLLLLQRTHWQNQSSILSDDCVKLRNQNKVLSAEKEREIENVEVARKVIHFSLFISRISP